MKDLRDIHVGMHVGAHMDMHVARYESTMHNAHVWVSVRMRACMYAHTRVCFYAVRCMHIYMILIKIRQIMLVRFLMITYGYVRVYEHVREYVSM